jgi:hypothetical protein
VGTVAAAAAVAVAVVVCGHLTPASYCDEKVANREIRVWHLVIENGY